MTNQEIKSRTLNILESALTMVRQMGFESVSISTLAKEVGMSKSGLFAHFKSKEKMHLMILDHAATTFTQQVFIPAFSEARGMDRLERIIRNWLKWYGDKNDGSCPFVVAAIEYDTKPGIVNERVQYHLNNLIHSLEKSVTHCIEEKQFKKTTDPKQVAYELYSLVSGALIFKNSMKNEHAHSYLINSLNTLLDRYQAKRS